MTLGDLLSSADYQQATANMMEVQSNHYFETDIEKLKVKDFLDYFKYLASDVGQGQAELIAIAMLRSYNQ